MPEHPLRAWLYGQRLSQREFAERIGLRNRSMLSLMFTGRRKPPEALARRISRATGKQVSIAELLNFEVPKNVKPPRVKRAPDTIRLAESLTKDEVH